MKILIVFTGGTIGSAVKNGIADTDITASNIIKNILESAHDIEFEYTSPFTILSENATCKTMSQLCSFMLNVDFENYDGIIITHGSDTLAYTSAMLGLTLSFSKIPIVITAANYVLSFPESNGIDNLKFSLDFIKMLSKRGLGGVFTVWKNTGEPPKAHLATRINEANGMPDKFTSWGGSVFSCSNNGIPFEIKPNEKTEILKKRPLLFDNNIILLHSYVGLDFNSINISGKKAVLLKLYHSSTACNESGNVSFTGFVKRCRKAGTDVFVCPVKRDKYVYSSANSISKEEIHPMGNMNITSAYCRLVLAYNIEDLKDFFLNETDIFYESLPTATNTNE